MTTANVSAANALKTRSFWLLWVVLFCNVTAGIGILEQASPMIQDFFRDNGTSAVSVAAAGGFVGVLSLFNMAGRFVWSSTSDVIGRKPIYLVYLGVGMVLYLLLALVGQTVDGVVRAAGVRDPVVLRRRVRDRSGVPAGPVRHVPGGRDPRPAADRVVGGGVAGPLIVNGFLDAQGEPGTLTASAYRPALFTMVGVLAVGLWRTCWCGRCRSGTTSRRRDGTRRVRSSSRWRRRGADRERAQRWRAAVRLVVSWLVVSVLLGYGVVQTVITAAKLFTQ